jgi:hypothetical protein
VKIGENLAGAADNARLMANIHQLRRPMNRRLFRLVSMKKRRHDDAAAL